MSAEMNTMDVVLFGLCDADYIQAAYSSIEDVAAIITPCARRFERVWLSIRLARMVDLPLKGLFCRLDIKSAHIELPENPIFIFFESKYAYSADYVNYLKSKYPAGKYVFVMVNPVSIRDRFSFWSDRLEEFDLVVSCVPEDAKRYGWAYYPSCYSKSIDDKDAVIKCDITYTGYTVVDRDSEVERLYNYFTERGLKCDFTIIGKNPRCSAASGIKYKKRYLPYREVVKKTIRSKAVLELTQKSLDYATLRTMEALKYGKKLITCNSAVVDMEHYRKSNIALVNDIPGIDLNEFLNSPFEEIPQDAFSPSGLVRFIKMQLR